MRPFWNWNYQRALGAPHNWDAAVHGPCEGLPVVTEVEACGTVEHLSYWELTWRERVRLLFGAKVRLTVMATGHPPISLNVGRPKPRAAERVPADIVVGA